MNDDLLKSKKMKNIFNRKKWPYIGSWKFLGLLMLSIVMAGLFCSFFNYLAKTFTTLFYAPAIGFIYFGYIAIISLSALRANSIGHYPLIVIVLGAMPAIGHTLGMLGVKSPSWLAGIPIILLFIYISYLTPRHAIEKREEK